MLISWQLKISNQLVDKDGIRARFRLASGGLLFCDCNLMLLLQTQWANDRGRLVAVEL